MTSGPRVTVLGGGSPFTAALFDAIRTSRQPLVPGHLTLFGRDLEPLEIVTRRARSCLEQLGWQVTRTTRLCEALEGAEYVIHQIRYGGLDGREDGEKLSMAYGIPADETLGPAALHCAIRSAQAVRRTAEHIARYCHSAWVLNLTNPLSVTTATMLSHGVTRCLGICELPETTAQAVAQLLEASGAVEWEYIGLNHRGFLYNLTSDGQSVFPALISTLPSALLPGVTRTLVESLCAVPLKYFALLQTPARLVARASVLRDLRVVLLQELACAPHRSPTGLRQRNVDWYEKAVVPILSALTAADVRVHVVNRAGSDGLVWEAKTRFEQGRLLPVDSPVPPPAVHSWINRFVAHERAVMDAVQSATPQAIRAALTLDPLVPAEHVDSLARSMTSLEAYS